MRVAITFKSHIINRYIIAEYKRIERDCRKFADVWFLYHTEEEVVLPAGLADKAFIINSAKVLKQGYKFTNFWWDSGYPSLLFFLEHQNYDYYWCIEYDVRYTGCWREFFSAYDDCPSDFLASYLVTKDQTPPGEWQRYPSEWQWRWKSISPDYSEDCKLACLFAVVRFSRRALQKLDEHTRRGAYGFCEAITPSIVSLSNLSVSDLNDSARDGRIVYLADTFSWCHHYTCFWQRRHHVLYHPVYGFFTKKGAIHLRDRILMRLGLRPIINRCRNAIAGVRWWR